MSIYIKLVAVCFLGILTLPSSASAQQTFFVSPTGVDTADGSEATPWGTMSFACARLSPGDTLIVEDGDYIDEGTIFVRFRDPETGVFLALLGDENHRSEIRSRSGNSRIFGEFDIRGSFISITGLEIIGDGESSSGGIGIFESMEIGIFNNVIHNHGGGGVVTVQCDLIDIVGNTVFNNAATNPDQHSGISVFQPIVRALDGTITEGAPISEQISNRYGFRILSNTCFENENFVPNPAGLITDGNGIIADDYLYTQESASLLAAVAGIGSPFGFAGTPMIDIDDDGERVPYARPTLISRNTVYRNGGRGIHCFLATNVTIRQNTCLDNLRSVALQDNIFRLENGEPGFLNGEISLSESDHCRVGFNQAISFDLEKAAASELYFNFAPENGVSTNIWRRRNNFIHALDPRDTVFILGIEHTSLSRDFVP